MFTTRFVAVAAFGVFVASGGVVARGDLTVVPPSLTSTEASTGQEGTIGGRTVRRFQCILDAAALTAIPAGSTITGITFRVDDFNPSAWPASGFTFSGYRIRVSAPATTAATASTTFAANVNGAQTTVYDAALSISAGSFPAKVGIAPAPFGPIIGFTNDYVYLGNGLCIDIDHTGTGLGSTEFMDATDPSEATTLHVVGVYANGSRTDTTGSVTSMPVIQIRYTTPPSGPFQPGVTKLLTLGDVAETRAGTTTTSLLNTSPRTIQAAIDAGELRGLGPTSYFTGVGYRGGSTSAWPSGAQSFTKYDIQLSRSNNPPSSLSDTIASNVGADAVTVRSGSLPVVSAALLPWAASGTDPAPWSYEIPFTTPYSYRGGPLLAVIRTDGISGGVSGTVDAIATGSPLYGSRVKARLSAASSVTATTTSALAYPEERWSVDAGTVAPLTAASALGGLSGIAQFRTSDITYQVIIAQSELTYLPIGSQITSMSLRSSGGAAPAINTASPDYEISMSTSRRTPDAASTTFADNEGADKILVRDGSLFIAANDLPGGVRFGTPIAFSRAFIYQGGDLCVTVRFVGANLAISVDQAPISSASVQIAGLGKAATTGSKFTPPVLRFGYNPSVSVPVPIAKAFGNNGYALLYGPGNVYQAVYSAEQLRGLRVGSVITGVSFRNGGFGPWPSVDTLINRFDLTLSTSPVAPQSMSNTFASNIGSDAVLVRSGPMNIPANAFPFVGGSRPEENRWFIQFTRPFIYTGGPLSMTIRNDASLSNVIYWDALESAPLLANGRWSLGSGADAATSNQGFTGAVSARFSFVPQGFCPADLNNDGVVDDGDFSVFLFAYNVLDCNDGTMPAGCPSDLNFDHLVDDSDFSIFVVAYNNLSCP